MILFLGRMLSRLPASLALAAGRFLGRGAHVLMKQRRLITRINLAACFPELTPQQRRELERNTFEAVGMGLVETALALWAPKGRLGAQAEIQGLEHLDPDRGSLLLMAHFTPVELIARLLNEALDPPAAMLVRRNADAGLEAALDQGRCSHAAATIEKKDMRSVMRRLKAGGRVMYGPDLNFTYGTVYAPFFGIQTATLTATADLVGRTGAALVPVWGWRVGPGRYRIVVEEPWSDFPSGDAVADATRVNAWMESRIREHPEQYLWLHRRFRNRPEGEPPFYPERARRAKHR